MVQCFNDVTSCNANSNVMMITAGQCCNSTGGSSRRVRVVSGNQVFCSSCFGEFSKLLFDIYISISTNVDKILQLIVKQIQLDNSTLSSAFKNISFHVQ